MPGCKDYVKMKSVFQGFGQGKGIVGRGLRKREKAWWAGDSKQGKDMVGRGLKLGEGTVGRGLIKDFCD